MLLVHCQRILAALALSSLLAGCGATVKTKRTDAREVWRTWRKDDSWQAEHAEAVAKLKAAGLQEVYQKDPLQALAMLRQTAKTEPPVRSAVAILAGDLASEYEGKPGDDKARGLWLLAAQGAYQSVQSTPKEVLLQDEAAPTRFMVRLYNNAVSHFVNLDFASGGLRGQPETIAVPGGDFRVRINAFRPGAVKPAQFDELIPTGSVKVSGFSAHGKLPGVGATFSGVITRKPEREKSMAFTAKRGLTLPVTAAIIFPSQTGEAEVSLFDPLVRREIPLGTRSVPISRDCTAPLALELNGLSSSQLGLGGFMHVEDRMKLAGLYMLQPYDPNKIPVLMIHGLQSSPLMWRDLIAELQADPELSAHYQFWVFYYPSGLPIPFSRQLIVDKLREVREHYDPQGHDLASRNMVVIGHSMGGVLSRSLITDVGDRFWKQFSNRDFSELKLSEEDRRMAHDMLFFKPVPQVRRAIFICAPHHGAKMATSWVGRVGSSLVRLPVSTLKLTGNVLTGNQALLHVRENHFARATSIKSLEPNAPIYTALNSSPMVRGVPYHSIIGDRGRGDTPNSSDGIVAYSSSHLEGAASELIVPGDHGAYKTPEALMEVRRILRLHLSGE